MNIRLDKITIIHFWQVAGPLYIFIFQYVLMVTGKCFCTYTILTNFLRAFSKCEGCFCFI